MRRSISIAARSGKSGLAWSLRLCALTSFAAISGQAAAQAPAQDQTDPAVIATARELAISGVKLAQDGQCAEALPKLERAEKLHHSQIVLTRLGDCYIKLGQLTAGIESLRTVLREPLPDNASDTLKQAFAEAGTLIEANKPKLGKLTIKVTGIDSAKHGDVTLTIDGKPMPSALIGTAHVSDPGEHTVAVTAPGYLPASHKLTLAPGGEETVALPLDVDPEAQAALQRAQLEAQASSGELAPKGMSLRDDAHAESPSHWPAYLTWGVSAAAIGVGVGFGFAALENKQSLEERCPNKLCPPDASDLLDTSRTNATISTIAYGVGITGVAVGALLFWLESRSSSDDGDEERAQSPRWRPTPNGVALTF
jgi:tetratricopeptide (TPR) repeat protein